MKLYANNSTESEIAHQRKLWERFVGKPLWVATTWLSGFGWEPWYIKVLEISDHDVAYQGIQYDAVKLHRDLSEFTEEHYINHELPSNFFSHNTIWEPIDVLTDDEVFSQILEEYNP